MADRAHSFRGRDRRDDSRAGKNADTARLDLAPPAPGLLAISLGLLRTFADDHEMLTQGMVLYDALYAWCRDCQKESHGWPPKD